MKKSRRPARSRVKKRPAKGAMNRRAARRRQPSQIKAGEFKAVCLSLMEQVRETGREFVITKRGQPVAKLGPVTESGLRPFVGRSRGVITATRDALMAPLGSDWDVDGDL